MRAVLASRPPEVINQEGSMGGGLGGGGGHCLTRMLFISLL